MSLLVYEKKFNYDFECLRFDAPKEDVGQWLNSMAINEVNRKCPGDWHVKRYNFDYNEDGTKTYTVKLYNRKTNNKI